MDIAQLRDFIAVVDSGSFTRAASVLFVSQPAVSQRMKQLESELGVRLVQRGPRGVVPTPAGRTLYRDAQQLIRRFDQIAEDVAKEPRAIRGPVAVGLPTAAAVHLAPALFSWTKRHYPGVRLRLFESVSGYIQELLTVGRMDLAVLYRDDAAPRPAETPLYSEELYLVGRSDAEEPPRDDRAAGAAGTGATAAAAYGDISLADMLRVPLVAPGSRSNLRVLIDRVFAEHGAVPTIAADVESLGTMVRIAESGEACALLPLSSVEALRGTPDLMVRRVVDPVIERHIAVCAGSDYYEPRDAVSVVRHGIVQVTTRLAERGAWPGIRLAARTEPRAGRP
ncbi:LysR substrate-binding domain-containing protein [Nocardiopsis dassonvillei]|uniref:LysR substrate-binding domain-containing protein n=1 Tax=Nocardiopsis dassonvillei TaxID=2014 RepID=UPI0020A3B9EA|nr:LysR substrate-binding domain-containing protein [Nocardiopsis dassonvillei]MCP3017069.1 LysR substrate-binding domain-containing protein [Nocardiopsis dassonvillei]